MAKEYSRSQRVAEQIMRELAELIHRDCLFDVPRADK